MGGSFKAFASSVDTVNNKIEAGKHRTQVSALGPYLVMPMPTLVIALLVPLSFARMNCAHTRSVRSAHYGTVEPTHTPTCVDLALWTILAISLPPAKIKIRWLLSKNILTYPCNKSIKAGMAWTGLGCIPSNTNSVKWALTENLLVTSYVYSQSGVQMGILLLLQIYVSPCFYSFGLEARNL